MKNKLLPTSNKKQLARYFDRVFQLAATGKEFPVNLEDIWILVYPRKDHAVRTLKDDFIQGVDYQILPKNEENCKKGRQADVYMLTTACMEWFVARKLRFVFEVYRKVLHEVIGQQQPYYQKRLKNGMIKTIGIKPVSPDEQKDNNRMALIKAYTGNIKDEKIKSEKQCLIKRAFEVATEIQCPNKRKTAVNLINQAEYN